MEDHRNLVCMFATMRTRQRPIIRELARTRGHRAVLSTHRSQQAIRGLSNIELLCQQGVHNSSCMKFSGVYQRRKFLSQGGVRELSHQVAAMERAFALPRFWS